MHLTTEVGDSWSKTSTIDCFATNHVWWYAHSVLSDETISHVVYKIAVTFYCAKADERNFKRCKCELYDLFKISKASL